MVGLYPMASAHHPIYVLKIEKRTLDSNTRGKMRMTA
jgi:hypothetical protein